METKICPSCREKNNPTFSVCWKCSADLVTGEIRFSTGDAKKDNAAEIYSFAACFVNIATALLLFYLTLGSQFQLGGFLVLGFLYLANGVGVALPSTSLQRIYFFSVVPASLFAAWNVTFMGGPPVSETFRMSPKSQLGMILLCVVLPLCLNLILKVLAKVKALSK